MNERPVDDLPLSGANILPLFGAGLPTPPKRSTEGLLFDPATIPKNSPKNSPVESSPAIRSASSSP